MIDALQMLLGCLALEVRAALVVDIFSCCSGKGKKEVKVCRHGHWWVILSRALDKRPLKLTDIRVAINMSYKHSVTPTLTCYSELYYACIPFLPHALPRTKPFWSLYTTPRFRPKPLSSKQLALMRNLAHTEK